MSEIEIKQMQEKINAGILLARKRLIEKVKKEDGELVVVRDGKSSASKPRTSNNTAYTKAAIISSAIRSRIFYMYPECERASQQKSREYPGFSVFSIYNRNYSTDSYL